MFMLRTPKYLSQETYQASSYHLASAADEGLRSIAWKPDSENPLAPALLNIDWLTAQPMLPFLTHVAPAHLLYRSIMAHGMEDSIEVIEWIRGTQLQKVLDFDLWEKSYELQSEDISYEKFMSWLRLWLQISSEFAVERFLELEEETIVLIFSKIFEIIPDGVSQVTEEVRENWWVTEDKKFFLRLRDEDPETFEQIKPFVDSLYKHNARLAASVFAHSAMLVRQESLEDGLRWKNGRLADQGFVAKDEALKVLAPKSKNALKQIINEARKLEEKRIEALNKMNKNSAPVVHDHKFDPEIHEGIAEFLSKLDCEEGVRYMQLALGDVTLKQITGSENISPEYFYEDKDFINESTDKIIEKCQKLLIRSEFVYSRSVNKMNLLIEKAFHEITNSDHVKGIYLKERVAHISNVLLSGVMSSISNDSLVRSLAIVKGVLNIGLELCLLTPSDYNINLDEEKNDLEKSVYCLNLVGPEFLFQVGWNVLLNISKETAQVLCEIDSSDSGLKNSLKTVHRISLSDSSVLEVSLVKLIENQKYSDVNVWLSSIESDLSSTIFFVIESLLSRIPMCPEILSFDKINDTLKFTQSRKPFETLDDIEKVKLFLKNFYRNLSKE
ncbi:DUF6178 family protein [Fluviispira multicolorata]|uniref:Uncharacterized protein n=1 Tax=Fluviispira multicolorata TaxID=2654512 RepID=A0A833JF48_9BACT|nr:DUF6178 family protein [Fluviispira multicolorata]KAB8030850.1 hypothetical protein GCL57_07705 [Fluviispira multicolorata]